MEGEAPVGRARPLTGVLRGGRAFPLPGLFTTASIGAGMRHCGARRLPCSHPAAVLGLLLLLSPRADADSVVLRIKAVNRVDRRQSVEVRASLPPRIGTNDIVSLGGLDLGYDVKTGTHYVHKTVEIEPLGNRTFDVALRDVWRINEAELEGIRSHAVGLVAKLARAGERQEKAAALAAEVQSSLDAVVRNQAENAIGRVSPAKHINAFDANLSTLRIVKRAVGHIENLVLETGQDTGKLLGLDRMDAKAQREEAPVEKQYKTAVYRITVTNPSPTRRQRVPKHNLPPEIKAYDVLNAGGLEVATDPDTGLSYVFSDVVEIEPASSVNFDITIRDKWDVNTLRLSLLQGQASNLLARVARRQRFKGVEDTVRDVLVEIAAVRSERGPDVVSPGYVEFFRAQSGKLDLVEQRIRRIESALRPIERNTLWGFTAQAPSMKTTWLIIYIILGFLALFSLFFFFRWYGKNKAERLQS
jgi:hypothetical protein